MADELEESGGLKEILASEILAKIEKGEPVEYDHVIVKGDLGFGNLNLPKYNDKIFVSSPIKIINSKIFGRADLGNTILSETVDFRNTEFMLIASFNGIQFNDDSYFIETEFAFGVSFDEARFNKGASFLKAKFNLDSSFNGTHFNENAWFWQAQFQLNSDFVGASFEEMPTSWKPCSWGKPTLGEPSLSRLLALVERSSV